MPMTDFFNSDSFNMVSLTQGIDKIPNMFGRIGELGLFTPEGVTTTVAIVEEMNGVLNLLQTRERSAPPTLGATGKRTVRSFPIPHIPHEDSILPEDVQNVRAFGSETQLEVFAGRVALKLRDMRNKQAITLEHLRAGALRGTVLDADGSTIFDYFTEFGITEKEVDFVLGTAGTEIKNKVHEVKRHIELNLQGELATRIHALCSPAFFDAFTSHATVKDAYARWRDGEALREDMRTGFRFAGITFEEYQGTADDIDGNARLFIPDGDCRFFPLGTQTTFRTYFAPANFNETVNTVGRELYAKQERRKFDMGRDLHVQSNPLPIVLRPELLVRGFSSN